MTLEAFPGRFDRLSLFAPAVVASTAAGSIEIDTLPYHGHAKAFLMAAAGGSGVTVNAKLQHSDTQGSGYEDVTGAAFPTNTANTAQNADIDVDLDGVKRYLRIHFTVAGGTGTGAVAAGLCAQKQYNH